MTAEAAMTAWTSGGDPVGYEPVFEDRGLPHQIVLTFTGKHEMAVSCTCPEGYRIEVRKGAFPARDAITAYARWHANRGIVIT
jgi:hypothetical protein